MQSLSCGRALFALCILLTIGKSAHAQFEQLANRVPTSANAIVAIDVKAVYASPLAKASGWNRSDMQAHQGGMVALPAHADTILMAAEMDFEFMRPLWEVAVAHMSQMPTMQDIATRSGGQLDRLAGAEAVERPNDSFIVALGPKVIGAMSPANRQNVSRWVRTSRSRRAPELSTYLADVLGSAKQSADQINIGLDLQGLFAPADVARRLNKSDSQVGESVDIQALAKLVAGIRGVRLGIALQRPARGRLSMEFEQDAKMLESSAKSLLLSMLANHGATIDDLQGWDVSADGPSINLQGELSQSGLRRVLSVLASPVGPMSASTSSSTSSTEAMAQVSQWYFQSVTNYLNDLFLGDKQPASFHQAKIWVQRYADKIADLETHQVDKDVLAFARNVVSSLDEIVSIIDRSQMRSDLRESNIYDSGRRRYGRYGAYGFYEKSYVTRDRQLIQADEAGRSARDTQVIADELRALSAETRQKMTERYNRPF